MQNNTGILTIQASLTRLGKRRLSEGKLDITKFAVSDDGINYSMINKNLPEKDIRIERSPLFSVWADGASSIISKIPISRAVNDKNQDITNLLYNFGWGLSPDEDQPIKKIGNKILFDFSSGETVFGVRDNLKGTFNIPVRAIPRIRYKLTGQQSSPRDCITITLHDNRFFDIGFSQQTIDRFMSMQSNNSARETFENRNIFKTPINLNTSEFSRLPKTLNLPSRSFDNTAILDGNMVFDLVYKGNYLGGTSYETLITLMCELTGHYENIVLRINRN
jgi:hypothetical protein